MGLVGEIYAKYNDFANQNLAHWLIEQKIEPVIPPIIDYFIQDLVNYKENIKANIRRKKMIDVLGTLSGAPPGTVSQTDCISFFQNSSMPLPLMTFSRWQKRPRKS